MFIFCCPEGTSEINTGEACDQVLPDPLASRPPWRQLLFCPKTQSSSEFFLLFFFFTANDGSVGQKDG